jgi:hypothetical protein
MKRPELPSVLRIGGLEYKVIEGDDDWRSRGSHAYYGTINYEQQTITVWDYLSPRKKAFVLLHEIAHAVMGGRTFPTCEDEVCELIEHGLSAFFVENPEFLAWYARALTESDGSDRSDG